MMRVCFPASLSLAAAGLMLVSLPASAKPRHHAKSTHANVRSVAANSRAAVGHHAQAAIGISGERATEIQTALIKQGYLTGEPTGTWDSQSAAAMQKLQGDNGWQTRLTPDSRALIKLGLGPQNATAGTVAATPASGQ